MHSVYQQLSWRNSLSSATEEPAGDRSAQLRGVANLTRTWLERIVGHDPQREQLMRLGALADELADHGTPSPSAIGAIRAMLCANCRRLDAAQGRCAGQTLERCPLLTITLV